MQRTTPSRSPPPLPLAVINEVYPNAFDESRSEWIELYNPNSFDVDISGWMIDTGSQQPDATLPSGATIPAKGYYLMRDKSWTPDNTSWPAPDYKGETITLANKNGWVRLEDSSGGVVDVVGWGSGAAVYEGSPYPKNPSERYSLERYVPGYDTENNKNDFTTRYPPTPRSSSS